MWCLQKLSEVNKLPWQKTKKRPCLEEFDGFWSYGDGTLQLLTSQVVGLVLLAERADCVVGSLSFTCECEQWCDAWSAQQWCNWLIIGQLVSLVPQSCRSVRVCRRAVQYRTVIGGPEAVVSLHSSCVSLRAFSGLNRPGWAASRHRHTHYRPTD